MFTAHIVPPNQEKKEKSPQLLSLRTKRSVPGQHKIRRWAGLGLVVGIYLQMLLFCLLSFFLSWARLHIRC